MDSDSQKKILKLLLGIILLMFAIPANAIVDSSDNTTQKIEKSKYLERVENAKQKENSKNSVELDTKSYTKIQIQENSVLTLDDCINIALENSPSIQRYQDLVTVANSLLGQSKANYFPSLNLGTGYTGSYINAAGTSDYTNNYGVNVSINQLLFSFGKVGSRIKKARLNKIAAD